MAAPFISTMTGTLERQGARVHYPPLSPRGAERAGNRGRLHLPLIAEGALEGFGDEVLQEFHQRQAAEDPFFSQAADDKAFAVCRCRSFCRATRTGRVRLTDEMIAHAGLKDRVTFVGMGRKFQI